MLQNNTIMEKSETIKELATALCTFQGEVAKIKKSETNPFFKSKYASLSDILDVIREPLSKNNLSFVQFPSGENGLITMIMHNSGEWISDCYFMKPSKNDPQGLGSVITYQRRYALGAILGLNIDDDDDGNNASNLTQKQPTKIKLTPKSEKWNKAKEFLKNGGKTADIVKNYDITNDDLQTLISEAI